jgi:hypothetical protein
MTSILRTGAIVLMTLAALLASFFTSGLTQALIELIAFFSLLALGLTRPSPLVQ